MSRSVYYRLCNTYGHDIARDVALQVVNLAQVQLWESSYHCPAHWTGGLSTKRAGVIA